MKPKLRLKKIRKGDDPVKSLLRPTVDNEPAALLEIEPDWHDHWWGMPQFVMGNAMPQYQVVVNFMTVEDVIALGKRIGIPLTARSKSIWYPPQTSDEPKLWAYVED
jgi:hypothetical protein